MTPPVTGSPAVPATVTRSRVGRFRSGGRLRGRGTPWPSQGPVTVFPAAEALNTVRGNGIKVFMTGFGPAPSRSWRNRTAGCAPARSAAGPRQARGQRLRPPPPLARRWRPAAGGRRFARPDAIASTIARAGGGTASSTESGSGFCGPSRTASTRSGGSSPDTSPAHRRPPLGRADSHLPTTGPIAWLVHQDGRARLRRRCAVRGKDVGHRPGSDRTLRPFGSWPPQRLR